jgi:hypothetical protein
VRVGLFSCVTRYILAQITHMGPPVSILPIKLFPFFFQVTSPGIPRWSMHPVGLEWSVLPMKLSVSLSLSL